MKFSKSESPIVLIRGGGDLASGVALRLHRVGFRVLVTELPQPLVVRRLASFAQAVFSDNCFVEEVRGQLVGSSDQALHAMAQGKVAVMVDPDAAVRMQLPITGLVDGRMTKKVPELRMDVSSILVGLGPGFIAGVNCLAVIETNRGPFLGRVYWQGSAESDSGIPETVRGFNVERVIYAPKSGVLIAKAAIGNILEEGEVIAEVDGEPLIARFRGVLRGLIHSGFAVKNQMKIGDLDPRCDPRLCTLASDKALAIGGGVLEVMLSKKQKEK